MSPSRVNCTSSPINKQSDTLSQTITKKQIPGCSDCVPQWRVTSSCAILILISLLSPWSITLNWGSEEETILIHFGKSGQEFVYCWINQLVKLISSSSTYSLLTTRNLDVSNIIGVMLFITGCNVLSFLRDFTKDYSFKTFNKHSDVIFPESAEHAEKIVRKVKSQN